MRSGSPSTRHPVSRGTPRRIRSAASLPTQSRSPPTQRSPLRHLGRGREGGPLVPPEAKLVRGNRPPLDLSRSDLTGLNSSLPAADLLPDGAAPITTDERVACWPRPAALWKLLDQFAPNSAQVAAWKHDVENSLNSVHQSPHLTDQRVVEQLERLASLAQQTKSLEVYLTESDRVLLRRIRYGIERRGAVWGHIQRIAQEQEATPLLINVIDALPVLQEVDRRVGLNPHHEAWRQYLMLDKLTQVATETWDTDSTVRVEASRAVLRRITTFRLTSEQHEFLQDPAILDLTRTLNDWAERPLDLSNLVRTLEQFELFRSASLASEVTSQLEDLQFSRYSGASSLSQTVNAHYRNANVRVSVSGQLLNDLLPVLEPIQQRIRDTILGAEVVGQNRTSTDLRLRLIDDPSHLRLRIQAEGLSRSQTVSTKGPFRFFSRDRAEFQAGKDLVVSANGLFVTPTEARAEGQSRLIDIESDYDQIPLLGWILRQVAMDEHREQTPQVRSVMRQKVASRVRKQMDESIHQRLTGAESRLDSALLTPLRDLNLDPQAMEMRTVDNRLVMRFRLASPVQLAAYTPRPRALPDNVLSFQMHESAANNLLQQLELEDQRFELEDLLRELTGKLRIDWEKVRDEIPEGVSLRLAKERPIQFEFDEDRVVVQMAIQELTTPDRTWRNFVARGRYRADMGQTHLDLERDGGIELISEQLGFRDQIALRGIFTKVMSHDHRLTILHGRIKENAQLNDLGVTQFVARDGWIGISVGARHRDRVATEADGVAR